MDATKGNIFSILNGNKQFLIPVYQRFYSWDKEHCERLWKDIVEMQKKNKNGHFVGSIVNIAEKAMATGVQKFMIIDGQQRMTTLTLLLIALRDYSIEHPEDKSINTRRIDSMLLKNEYEEGDEKYKLLLTETDRETLINIVDRIPIERETSSKIKKNYQFFMQKIDKMEITPAEIYESIGKLQIVNITLDRELDDAQAIFESLNSTGKELSEADLIRNYVLMKLNPKEQEKIYRTFWRPMELLFEYYPQENVMDRFFRDYLTAKLGKIPNINKVYEEFKRYNIEYLTEVEELCNDLIVYARYYSDIIFCKSKDEQVKELYKDINNLKMEVSYPFLLKVHNDYKNELISYEEFVEILKLCISYVFRRSVCEIPTNSLNKTFATAKNEIDSKNYLASVKNFFITRDSYKRFPDNDEFEVAFRNRDFYRMKTRNYVLEKLENYNNKVGVIVENHTVEHIMPQNKNLNKEWQSALGNNWREVQKKYLHTIGNLTLTSYNSEMSDKSFMEKMTMEGGFKESALRLNRYVINQTEWNAEKIEERAKQLSDLAIKIWEYPNIDGKQQQIMDI